MFDINTTRTMLEAIERSHKPTTTLVDVFFPNVRTFVTETVEIEYRKGGRRMAPFIVPNTKGVNVSRVGSELRVYKAPLMRPKRVIAVDDVMARGFGEGVYSTKTPEERAVEMRARDLADLQDMIARRQEWMAAQLLVNGSYKIEGVADDGVTQKIDTLSFDFNNKTTISGNTWDKPAAKIYDDIGDVSQKIRRNAGEIPTVAIMSSNVVKYLLNNAQLLKYMMVPPAANLSLMSMQPRLQRPDLMRVGYIQALNMELYAYDGVYEDDKGALQQYIPDDHVIVGIPGCGQRLFGEDTQMESDNQLHTYEGMYIPKITADAENDVSSLALSSRCVVCPRYADDWAVIKVK